MRSPDVIVIGAGVIGSAIAYVLASTAKLRVLVIERGSPGCEASNAAAGVLAVASSQARGGALLHLRLESARLFPSLVATLEDETGIDLGYRRGGFLSLAFSETEAAALSDLVLHRQQQGLSCEMLRRDEVLELEPAINPAISAGAIFAGDCSIESDRLVTALVTAAQRRNVRFCLGSAVEHMRVEGATVRLQVNGETLEAPRVVVAAGAWSGELLAGCGVKVPLRPARGEMVAVRPFGWRVDRVVSAGDGYLVPRSSGEVLLGSTTTFVGFDKRVTDEGIRTLFNHGERIMPSVVRSTLVRKWAGLRPCPTIRRPIVAPLPGLPNVILATGHHRNGILLAPITARLVGEIIAGTPPSVPLAPLSFRRH